MRLEEVFAQILQEPAELFSDNSSPQTIAQWNSLKHIEIILQIESTYGVRFSPPEIPGLRSLRDIRAILVKKGVQSA